MKIIKCPKCALLLNTKNTKKCSWKSNPFVRTTIRCESCGANLKPKLWLILMWWVWMVTGVYFMFSEYESPYISLFILGTLGVMFGLMRFGLSHESEQSR